MRTFRIYLIIIMLIFLYGCINPEQRFRTFDVKSERFNWYHKDENYHQFYLDLFQCFSKNPFSQNIKYENNCMMIKGYKDMDEDPFYTDIYQCYYYDRTPFMDQNDMCMIKKGYERRLPKEFVWLNANKTKKERQTDVFTCGQEYKTFADFKLNIADFEQCMMDKSYQFVGKNTETGKPPSQENGVYIYCRTYPKSPACRSKKLTE